MLINKKKLIVVAGKSNLSIYILNKLLKYFKVNDLGVVISSSDNGKNSWQLSLKRFSSRNKIKIYRLDEIYKLAEIFISCEYEKIIDINKFKTKKLFNYHFSLLPKYRGVYTSIWPLLNEDKYSGVTIHQMTNKIDAGKIILQKKYLIKNDDCSLDIYLKNILCGQLITDKFMKFLLENKLKYKKQIPTKLKYKSKKSYNFKKNEISIFSDSNTIQKTIRALSFRPYQLAKFKNQNIVNCEILKKASLEKPGTILFKNKFFLEISTLDKNIRIYFDKHHEFIKCIKKDDILGVKKLKKNIVNINDRDKLLRTPLIIAAIYESKKCLEYFINTGANKKLKDVYEKTYKEYLDNE